MTDEELYRILRYHGDVSVQRYDSSEVYYGSLTSETYKDSYSILAVATAKTMNETYQDLYDCFRQKLWGECVLISGGVHQRARKGTKIVLSKLR